MKGLITLIGLILVLASPLFAESNVYCDGVNGYTGCDDTYMITYHVESNFGDAIYIECQSEDGRDGGSRMKPLIRFNHLGLRGNTVRACTLQLFCYLWIGEDQEIQLHEVLRDWKESQTTCVDYRAGSPWAAFACGTNNLDASSAHVCSLVDPGGTGYKSFPLPVSLVQKWVDAPGDTNDGLLVLAPEDISGMIKDRSFRSSDMFVSSQRPRLIVHYDSCDTGLESYPVLLGIDDVPGDAGGMVRLTWTRSVYDVPGSDTSVERYKIWRKRQQVPPLLESCFKGKPARAIRADDGRSAWEVVGRVRATGACRYTVDARTYCDSSGAGICWSRFYVSACTDIPGVHFDSPVGKGYSVDNLLQQPGEPPGQADDGKPGGSEDVSKTVLRIEGSNPGYGGFSLRLSLAQSDYARVRVYDVSGRVVATLLDAYLDTGPYTIRWDSKGPRNSALPPGIYIVNLLTSTESRSEKLVLIR